MINCLCAIILLLISGCAYVSATATLPDGKTVEVNYVRILSSYNATVEDPATGLKLTIGTQTETDKIKEILGAISALAPLTAGVAGAPVPPLGSP